ncbi:RlpA-like double-psi beta-barrel-protein domain-containing protein-containing protein [Gilbertella persicaria]|uniref:RlpA-like double-psi beta-barrel-protein domain-containing protein-containing protein n=1 Tax=Gilbertella persicaria TaxID=101096 RepID=UPI00221F5050|nr:RlpA-like double-psi beta-barrel-protein domain-containing protein-containing protein [Gilbertella persicaria]KAI8098186.1 RlpA-like double-psi beta-barrel-protein domain-containing protein-containing protein [Gilbertella persicaria]
MVSIAILVLLCLQFVYADFPNDMFYHHHPDLIDADINQHFSQPNNRLAQPDSNQVINAYNSDPYGRNDYGYARNDYSYARNAAYDYGRANYDNNGRANYNNNGRANGNSQKIAYNEDGSINWERSKAAVNRNQAQQDDYPYDSRQSSGGQGDSFHEEPGFVGGLRLAGALPDDGYHRGEGTYYDLETHVGSCGKQSQNMELVAAVNAQEMGQEEGSQNPHCGQQIEVVGPSGKSIHVTVVDNCKTCQTGGLDLSPAAFEELGDFSHGSIPIKWKFIE